MRVWDMRPGISIEVSPLDHHRLEVLIRDRNTAQKHVWRAEIVLLSAAGIGTVEIMRRTAKSKTCVWRWQERFAAEGVEGLLRDKTDRKSVGEGKSGVVRVDPGGRRIIKKKNKIKKTR